MVIKGVPLFSIVASMNKNFDNPGLCRVLPQTPYNGLTIALSNPSRFDLSDGRLLTGLARGFAMESLYPHFMLSGCDIRSKEYLVSKPLLNNTKGILVCGENALKLALGLEGVGLTLHQSRGYVFKNPQLFGDAFLIPTYLPQDCIDPVNWEGKKNQELIKENASIEIEEGAEEDGGKNYSPTKRSNYRFWFKQDVQRLIYLVQNGSIPKEPEVFYYLNVSIKELENDLASYTGPIVLDIETSMEYVGAITCLSFGLIKPDGIHVYGFTWLDYNLQCTLSPRDKLGFIKLINLMFSKHEIVVHNGGFDLFILLAGYSIKPPRWVFDTMLAHNRKYLGTEKSLGHCMSLYTWQKYHKDEGYFFPKNSTQERKLLEYNAKDVYGTALVYLKLVENETPSMEQANNSLVPYLWTSFIGLNIDTEELEALLKLNQRKLDFITRVLGILTGIPKFNAGSSQQCAVYFHDMLLYEVIKYSEKTKKPSVDINVLYKLRLNYPENPVINFIITYRAIAKENGSLKINLWKTTALVNKKKLD